MAGAPRILAISGVGAGVGKSSIARALARAVAGTRHQAAERAEGP